MRSDIAAIFHTIGFVLAITGLVAVGLLFLYACCRRNAFSAFALLSIWLFLAEGVAAGHGFPAWYCAYRRSRDWHVGDMNVPRPGFLMASYVSALAAVVFGNLQVKARLRWHQEKIKTWMSDSDAKRRSD